MPKYSRGATIMTSLLIAACGDSGSGVGGDANVGGGANAGAGGAAQGGGGAFGAGGSTTEGGGGAGGSGSPDSCIASLYAAEAVAAELGCDAVGARALEADCNQSYATAAAAGCGTEFDAYYGCVTRQTVAANMQCNAQTNDLELSAPQCAAEAAALSGCS